MSRPMSVRRVALFAAFAASVFSIASPAAPMAAQTPAVTGSTSAQSQADDVMLDLAVHDRRNRPVLDLRPGDITVTDNGKPVRLADLHLVNGDQKSPGLITLLFDRPGLQDPKTKSEDSLFDISASSVQETSKKLRQEGMKFLKAFPAGKFQFAVMDVWGRLQIQEAFNQNLKSVAEAIPAAVEPQVYGTVVTANELEKHLAQVAITGLEPAGAAASVWDRSLARSMYTALVSSGQIASDQHLSLSQGCLLALAEAQRSLPGRKAIIYFTSTEAGGDPSGKSGKDSQASQSLKSIIGAANRAGVNIYVVVGDELKGNGQMVVMSQLDPGKQTSEMMGALSPSQLQNDIASSSIALMLPPPPSVLAVSEEMNQLTKQTGGEVLNGSESLIGPVRNLVRNFTTYYEASFVPPAGAEDGSFHATVFKATRRGLKLRARAGYLALPPNEGIGKPLQPFEIPLVALLKRPIPPAEVDYRARVMQMERGEDGDIALAALEVPVSGLDVREDTSTHLNSAHISVLLTINDSTGTQMERFREDIVRRWSGESGPRATPDVISFERSFAAPPGKYVLETAILDDYSGKAAAGKQTFEIHSARPMPDLSDLMIVREVDPADNDQGEPDLLWGNQQSVRPNLYGKLAPGARNVSVFFLAHTDPKLDAPTEVKLEVLHDGVPLKGRPLTATLKADGEFIPVIESFSISSAADGDYQVRAILTQGGRSAETMGEFALTGADLHRTTAALGDVPLAVDPPELTAAKEEVDQPGQEELQQILEDASRNALRYRDGLPDLICQQTTERLFAVAGIGDWSLKDTIVEDLTYVNHEENRTEVARKSAGESLSNAVSSTGEFGSALSDVFVPKSKAAFIWKGTVMLRGEPAEVFDYRVAQANSAFFLDANPGSAKVGYHGQVYIDRATHGVMSVTNIADDIPKKFSIRGAAVRVDYDYVAINDHDYLLPVTAQVIIKLNGNSFSGEVLRRNDIAFSNFRKYGSSAHIVGTGPPAGEH